jgi:hypothetical protein
MRENKKTDRMEGTGGMDQSNAGLQITSRLFTIFAACWAGLS